MNSRLLFTLGGILVGLFGIYFIATQVVPSVLVTLTKAAPATRVSLQNSLVIGDKILAKADGSDSCVINVFLLDTSNKGVVNKRVELDVIAGVTIIPVSAITDSDGKSTFEVTSNTEGQFQLTARAEGVSLPRGITVTFRNF